MIMRSASNFPDSTDNRLLLARIASGDHSAFESLVRPFIDSLLRYAFSIVRNKEIAEDVVQDVLCWVWENRNKLDVKTSVRSYLFSAIHHRGLNAVQRINAEEKRGGDDHLPYLSSSQPDQQEIVEQKDLEMHLARAIASLPERRRQIMLLRHQELSYPEIAEVLGVSVKTVEAQVRLGFIALREAMQGW